MDLASAPARPSRDATAVGLLEMVALAVAAAALLGRVLVSVNLGLDADEAYYALWANWLAPGYLDHPPGVALSIAMGEWLLGPTYLGVRLFTLVGSVLVVLALYRTTHLLVPHPSAPSVAVIWYSLLPATGIGFVATPDGASVLFWTLALWASAEAVIRQRPNWWLAVGLFAGLGMVAKYTNAWLGIGYLLYLLATREGRTELRRWQPWAGGLLALAVFSPVLWWNATHDWKSFLFQGSRIVTSDAGLGRMLGEFIYGQMLSAGPVLVVCMVAGMAWSLSGRDGNAGARLGLPVLTSLPLVLYFLFHSLHSHVEANWLQLLLPALSLVGASWLVTRPTGGWKGVARLTALWVQPVLGGAFVAFIYIQALVHPFDLGAADRTRMLRGWAELSTSVRGYADEVGARTIWTSGDYRLTGELFFHGKAVADPRPVRDLRQRERYDFIPAALRYPAELPGLLVIAGEPKPDAGKRFFEKVELLGTLERGEGRVRDTYSVYAVSMPTAEFPAAD